MKIEVRERSSLDYEAEYNRLMELHHKQDCELQAYKEKFRYLEQENRELKAKLDMVYLIFRKD